MEVEIKDLKSSLDLYLAPLYVHTPLLSSCMQSLFAAGNIITLRSISCDKFLCIRNDDEVEVQDDRDGKDAHFIVHVRRPLVVSLQSAGNVDNWLGIYNQKLIGSVSFLNLWGVSCKVCRLVSNLMQPLVQTSSS